MSVKLWRIAIYARVSTDKKEQQESVGEQVRSLQQWVEEKSRSDTNNIYELVSIYEDYGFSGTNFEREGFLKMKKDIEMGKVNMVVTRDLSRFSRNYILAGFYLEEYFKLNGVRFISVLDNVDTLKEVNDIIPFKNILNEMYVKDCSKRTKAGLHQRMLRGSCISSKAPYGYKLEREYNGRTKFVKLVAAGDKTTDTVRRIFSMYIEGMSYSKIAALLNKEGVPPPSFYLNHPKAKYGAWSSGGIKSILTNPKYGGIMIQQRWEKVSYKSKIVKKLPKEHWINGGEFTGIISKDQFELVQELIKKRARRSRNKGKNYLFSTIIYCGDCGGSMIYRKSYKGYKCANSQFKTGKCTSHSIKEANLVEIICMDIIKRISTSIDKEEVYKTIEKNILKRDELEKRIQSAQTKMKKMDNEVKSIYRDRDNNLVNDRNFKIVLQDIELRQNDLLNEIENLKNKMEVKEKGGSCVYLNQVEELLSFNTIDRSMVERLIDSITIYENKNDGKKQIKIAYKFKE